MEPLFQRITNHVIRITCPPFGPYSPQPTYTYLVGSKRSRILIDAGNGNPEHIKSLIQLLRQESALISTVLLTHSHANHCNGLPFLEKVLTQHQHPSDRNHPHVTILRQFKDNQNIMNSEGDVYLRAIATPGHADQHFSFFLKEEDSFFSGDAIVSHPSRPNPFKSIFEDVSLYLSSLKKIKSLFPKVIYSSHDSNVVVDTIAHLNRAIQTQQAVSDVILESIAKTSPVTTLDLVKIVSDRLIKNVANVNEHHYLLHGLVRQHLELLEHQGKVQKRFLAHDPMRRTGSTDPSKIKGPGGLTMDQIFSKVQETRRRDWEFYREQSQDSIQRQKEQSMARTLLQLHPLHRRCTSIHESDSWTLC